MFRLFPSLAPGAALAVALVFVLARPAPAGPPWISIEVPANPHLRESRGALLLVRAYHHDLARAYRVTGVAEGLVDGARRSVPLTLASTGTAGVYAVDRPDLDAGRWILVLTLDAGSGGDATALVTLNGDGEVSGVRVPTRGPVDGFTIPRPATEAEIEALLRGDGLAGLDVDGPGAAPLAAVAALAGLALAVPLTRRRRAR